MGNLRSQVCTQHMSHSMLLLLSFAAAAATATWQRRVSNVCRVHAEEKEAAYVLELP
jgi:hypothetical protein